VFVVFADLFSSLQALRWKDNPEESYNLTLYQSALTYITDLMVQDYPKGHD
jgi:hypothetical protein